ncbi:hypothetical protein TCDM_10174 [Trypanosoma cruzi Dm28c]|uniref:Uncharacterized protein n=1 Tax=Trypanosoma cruzi Dm28c TaxID=1416333 RepID=V5D3Z2_TRYCR|nr:hypothetical protein TCDM_10174 [Trypanosoma cruzi Dm28c]
MEGRTVEAHATIFLILFSGKICGQFLEQHGSWVLFLCGSFFHFFSFLCVAVIEDDIFSFSFFHFFFLSFKV